MIDTAETFDASSSSFFAKIFGGGDNDTIIGSDFNDRLYGEAGDDMLTGGLGKDRFFYEDGWGQDVITDFTAGDDRIDLRAVGITSMSELSITDSSGDALISYDGQSITLLGIAHDSLVGTNFVFARAISDKIDDAFEFETPDAILADLFSPQEDLPEAEFEDPFLTDPMENLSRQHEASLQMSEAISHSAVETFGLEFIGTSNDFDIDDLGVWDLF